MPGSLGIVLVAMALSCSSVPNLTRPPDSEGQGTLVRTLADTLILAADGNAWRGAISFRVSNPGAETLYYMPAEARLDAWTGTAWVAAFSPVLPGIYAPPIPLPPGTDAQLSFSILAAMDPSGAPQFSYGPEHNGTHSIYKLLYRQVIGTQAGLQVPIDPVPPDSGRSNNFVLVIR